MNMPLQHSQVEPRAAVRSARCPDWITYAAQALRQNGQQPAADHPKASK